MAIVSTSQNEDTLFTRAQWGLAGGYPDTVWATLTGSGTVTTPGDGYEYHTFTSSGSITAASGTFQYLLVGGGGGGGGYATGGGGGAGAAVVGTTSGATSGTPFTVTVGTGGAGGPSASVGAAVEGTASILAPPATTDQLATGGTAVWDAGANEWVHTFTTDGTFTLNAEAGSLPVSYLVVAGGGGGGGGQPSVVLGPGGGGGEVVTGTTTVTSPVDATIGAGGAGGVHSSVLANRIGQVGVASTFGAVSATPGGGGGVVATKQGGTSGSGNLGAAVGSTGTSGGGGGGDSAVGLVNNGGAGTAWNGTTYGGGGAGSGGSPGAGGGGTPNNNGVANTGGGGGGLLTTLGGTGGSGVVIVRYDPADFVMASAAGGGAGAHGVLAVPATAGGCGGGGGLGSADNFAGAAGDPGGDGANGGTGRGGGGGGALPANGSLADGGAGYTWSDTNTYGGGGGAGVDGTGGTGGAGGGGAGGDTDTAGTAGTVNTGGGGGGAGHNSTTDTAGGAGGDGVVICRTAYDPNTLITGGTAVWDAIALEWVHTVSAASSASLELVGTEPIAATFIVVGAGGGAGGSLRAGGGGAGGEVRQGTMVIGTDPVAAVAGAKGLGQVSPYTGVPTNGGDSTLGEVVSAGGGYGGYYINPTVYSAESGRVQAGSHGHATAGANSGLKFNAGAARPGSISASDGYGSGGGAGAGGNGTNADPPTSGTQRAGDGGVGVAFTATGTFYGGGGGGAGESSTTAGYGGGLGGNGGGGDGGSDPTVGGTTPQAGFSATPDTGGGGGGGQNADGGNGADGIIVVRYDPVTAVAAAASYSDILNTYTMARQYWASDPDWTNPGDGVTLTTVRDAGTTALDLSSVQVGGGTEPTYNATGINGRPAYDFHASSETVGGCLGVATGTQANGFTEVLVGKLDVAAVVEARFIDCGDVIANPRGSISSNTVGWRSYHSGALSVNDNYPVPDLGVHVFVARFDTNLLRLWVDGILVGEDLVGTVGTVTGLTLGASVGSFNGLGPYATMNGKIGYAARFNGNLTAESGFAIWTNTLAKYYGAQQGW